MSHVLVLGAGPVGLVTAMLLAGDGHRVTVVDRDPADLREEASAKGGAWKRPGVAQFGHTHILMPGGYQLLARELPGAIDRLLAAGGSRHNMIGGAWGLGNVGPRQEEDVRFETIAARRPVLEAVLFAEAAQTPGITLRTGEQVTGLVTGNSHTIGRHHITGVTIKAGQTIGADLIIDVTGRSTQIPALLADLGASPVEQNAAAGFRYYTRYFRSADGSLPLQPSWPVYHYNSVSAITAPGDNGTWSLTLVTSGRDQELRSLKDPEVWNRVAAQYPDVAHWAVGEPLTGVNVVGGTESRRRTYVHEGRPVVTGLVAIGDAWATTNPQYGMGMTMGTRHAVLLRDTLRTYTTDNPVDLALELHDATEKYLAPIWEGSQGWDTHRLAEIDAEIDGKAYATHDDDWNLRAMIDAVRLQDGDLLRGYADVGSMLATPDEALAQRGLIERVVELGLDAPRYSHIGPDRAQLLDSLYAG